MIVGFGTYDVSKHPRVGILLDGLRSHGLDVAEINRPLGLTTAERVRMLRQPWRLPTLLWRLLVRWNALARDARRLRREGNPTTAVLVGYLGHFDVFLARILFRRTPILLDHLVFAADTARDRGAAGLRVRLLDILDRGALSVADIVIVDTAEHAAMLPRRSRSVVVPVGARAEWFDAGGRAATSQGPLSVVFFGLFTPLQGATIIADAVGRALDLGAELRVTMVGRGQDWERAHASLGDRPTVEWIDWVEPAHLPSLVAGHDVCLGIFGTTPKAQRVVPNKVFEGAAAGCAIVTSDTAPQREALRSGALFVPPGDPDALAAVLLSLASSQEQRLHAKDATHAISVGFHAEHIVTPLLDVLKDVT